MGTSRRAPGDEARDGRSDDGGDGAGGRGRAQAARPGPVLPGARRVHRAVHRLGRRGDHHGPDLGAGPGDPGSRAAGRARRDGGARAQGDRADVGHADLDADGQDRGGRPDPRARAGRRRLRDEAVQPARAGPAGAGDPAPRRPGRRPGTGQLRRGRARHRRAAAAGHGARRSGGADPHRVGRPHRAGHRPGPGVLPVRADQPGTRVRVRGLRAHRRLAREEPAPQGRGGSGQSPDRADRPRRRLPARPGPR
jgi:hypothetical protein